MEDTYGYETTAAVLRVYDMDGTLANTEHLSEGRRRPADLLAGSPLAPILGYGGYLPSVYPEGDPEFGVARFLRSGANMAQVPGIDAVAGVNVALITRAPVAYASTLAGLLGLERYPIWASSRVSRAEKLVALAKMFDVPLTDVVYVGDEDEDFQAAEAAGCQFESLNRLVRPELGQALYPDMEEWPGLDRLKKSPARPASTLVSVGHIVASLRAHPYHARALLQARLARLVRPEHRYCLVPAGRMVDNLFDDPGVPAYLFSRQEHDDTYLQFLRGLFPARSAPAPTPDAGDCHYFVRFRNAYQSGQPGADPLGRLMSEIKDYSNRSGRMRSGAEVRLAGLRFVADVMAAHLVDWFRGFAPPPLIDYVRPHDFSLEQPGQVSLWLARWVAQACRFATGNDWRIPEWDEAPAEWAVLIDDQRTSGSHITQHVSQHGARVATITWSWSNAEEATGPSSSRRRGNSVCYWPDPGPCPTHDGAGLVGDPFRSA